MANAILNALSNQSNKYSLSKLVMVVAVISTLNGCGKHDQPNAAAGGGMVMPVSVIELQSTSVPISTEAVAQTEGAKEVEIRPRVGGILLKRLYEEGAQIKAGQAMFQIDPVPYQIALSQAKAQVAQQNARIEQTKREAARLQGLLATQSISQREYDNAFSDNAIAVANLQQAQASVREAELNLSYTTVTAPVSGVSGRFQFSEGALVAANTSLLTTVVQLSPIWVRFSLSDNEVKQLGGNLSEHSVKEVILTLPDGSEYAQKGKLNFASSQIDASLGTQQFRATFLNDDKKLLPGQFVRARVVTGSKDGVFLVPQAAVMTSDQGKFVFVVNENNEIAPRPVVVGSWLGKDWIVLSGLQAGEKVAVDNLIKLRPGAKVAPHPLGEAPVMPSPSAQSAKAKQV
ncbi:MAG TPA: efflux RND transporter periplasmic adaptor subunit [Methylophilaceae bacterium]|jgi:membrane fusion protein (multidrug efflux system)